MNDSAELNERLRRAKIETVPAPWKRVSVHVVGGLMEVGYVPGKDLLLVVSSDGRGLFDCITGQRLARDYTPVHEGDWYDEIGLLSRGIGVVGQQAIRLAGLHGGGLPKFTRDGWGLELVAPDWPLQSIFIQPSSRTVLIERFADGCVKIEEDQEIRTFGFSDTGLSFIIALPHSLIIYSRP